MAVRTEHLRRAQELVAECEQLLTHCRGAVAPVKQPYFVAITALAAMASAYMALGEHGDVEPEAEASE